MTVFCTEETNKAALVGVRDRLGTLRDPDSVVDPDLAERLRVRLTT